MPPISEKNLPLSAAGADLGLSGGDTLDQETEEERKKRLAMLAKSQAANPMSLASQMLLGGAGG